MREEKKETKRKSPWRFAFAALTVCAAWELLCSLSAWLIADVFGGISFNVTRASTLGIIGGADGPTAVFVTATPVPVWQLLLWILMLGVGIRGFRWLSNRK